MEAELLHHGCINFNEYLQGSDEYSSSHGTFWLHCDSPFSTLASHSSIGYDTSIFFLSNIRSSVQGHSEEAAAIVSRDPIPLQSIGEGVECGTGETILVNIC